MEVVSPGGLGKNRESLVPGRSWSRHTSPGLLTFGLPSHEKIINRHHNKPLIFPLSVTSPESLSYSELRAGMPVTSAAF